MCPVNFCLVVFNKVNFVNCGSSCSISDQAQDDYVDNSLALVPVDLPMESRPPDPVIVNASVRDVLDALRNAREKLQLSMAIRSHMIKVGSK